MYLLAKYSFIDYIPFFLSQTVIGGSQVLCGDIPFSLLSSFELWNQSHEKNFNLCLTDFAFKIAISCKFIKTFFESHLEFKNNFLWNLNAKLQQEYVLSVNGFISDWNELFKILFENDKWFQNDFSV